MEAFHKCVCRYVQVEFVFFSKEITKKKMFFKTIQQISSVSFIMGTSECFTILSKEREEHVETHSFIQ